MSKRPDPNFFECPKNTYTEYEHIPNEDLDLKYVGKDNFYDKDVNNFNFRTLEQAFINFQKTLFDKIYPLGSVYLTTDLDINPDIPLSEQDPFKLKPKDPNKMFMGTYWIPFGAGRVLVGYGIAAAETNPWNNDNRKPGEIYADDSEQVDPNDNTSQYFADSMENPNGMFFYMRERGGQYYHKLTKEELARHDHGIIKMYDYENGNPWQGIDRSLYNEWAIKINATNYGDTWYSDHATLYDMTNENVSNCLGATGGTSFVGNDSPHNNMQPYYAVGMWRRVTKEEYDKYQASKK